MWPLNRPLGTLLLGLVFVADDHTMGAFTDVEPRLYNMLRKEGGRQAGVLVNLAHSQSDTIHCTESAFQDAFQPYPFF